MKYEYSIFSDVAYTMAVYSTVAALAVQVRRGRSKEYIQQLFKDMVDIYDMPAMFGKQISMDEVMKDLKVDYGIDFGKIKVHIETESEFCKRLKEASRNKGGRK